MNNYIELAIRTKSPHFFNPNVDLLHAAIGIMTEVVELHEADSELNVFEENGDILWYCAIGLNSLGRPWPTNLPDVSESNLLATAGELLDDLKKACFYGRGIDREAAEAKIIDIIAHVAEAVDLEETKAANIRKLAARYPNKFSQEEALIRNEAEEMAALQ